MFYNKPKGVMLLKMSQNLDYKSIVFDKTKYVILAVGADKRIGGVKVKKIDSLFYKKEMKNKTLYIFSIDFLGLILLEYKISNPTLFFIVLIYFKCSINYKIFIISKY